VFPFLQGKILLGDKGAPLEKTNIIASNGIIHMVDDLLVPASIVPILPHRCDVNETRITLVGGKQNMCIFHHIVNID